MIYNISPRNIRVGYSFKEEQKVEVKVDSEVTSKMDSKGIVNLNSTQKRIVKIMKRNLEITIAKLFDAIGIGNSVIKKNIAKLKGRE